MMDKNGGWMTNDNKKGHSDAVKKIMAGNTAWDAMVLEWGGIRTPGRIDDGVGAARKTIEKRGDNCGKKTVENVKDLAR